MFRNILVFILVMLTCFSCSMGQSIDEKQLRGQVYAPDFPSQKEWLNTKVPISLKQLKGKIVLLDFWTYCCINCHHVFPDLARLEKEFAEELVVIGVHSAKFTTEQETNNIREAILRHNIRHPVINDNDFEVWRSYGVSAWPSFALINAYGKLVGTTSGEGIYDRIVPYVKSLIDFHEKDGSLDRKPIAFELEESKELSSILAFPGKIISDEKENLLYLSDSNHHRIVIIDSQGIVVDYIGCGTAGLKNGSWEEACFNQPQGIALDGTKLYIADTENHAIRVADLESRKVSTLAGTGKQARRFHRGGVGTQVSLNSPWDVGVYKDMLYVAMAGFHQIWRVNPLDGEAKPYVGSGRENIVDGSALQTQLAQPSGISILGDILFFADSETSSIRQVNLKTDEVTTHIGKGLFDFGDKDGQLENALLQHPLGLASSSQGIFIADTYNNKIKVISRNLGEIRTLAGSGNDGWKDGLAMESAFNEPGGLAILNGWLYVSDTNNHLIRKVSIHTGQTETLYLSNIEALNMENFVDPEGIKDEEVLWLSKILLPYSDSELKIDIQLPEGYKFTDGAPNKLLILLAEGTQFNQEDLLEINPSHTKNIALTSVSENKDTIDIKAYLYYCEEQKAQKCFFKNLHYRVPIERREQVTDIPIIVLNVE